MMDLVVVGGGIAGGALATVMARDGYEVTVLEREPVYRDRVRGEWLAPWGVAEAQRLGVYDVLVGGAGGHHLARFGQWDEVFEPDRAPVMDLDRLVPGVPGPLSFGHPQGCQALASAAAEAGATILRDVDVTGVVGGGQPSVAYRHGGQAREVAARLVVGADGRRSFVRQAAGLAVQHEPADHLLAGLLVDGAGGWPDDTQAMGTEGDVMFLVFPQGSGRCRLYLAHSTDDRHRFSGPGAAAAFLATFPRACLPGSDVFAAASPAGPCASQASGDSWTDSPVGPGVVLVGDAAGWNDPILGQGLSIGLRDVRLVTERLRETRAWSMATLALYAQERGERMRRLRLCARLTAALNARFGTDAARRRRRALRRASADLTLGRTMATALLGPDGPAEAFTDAAVERLLRGPATGRS